MARAPSTSALSAAGVMQCAANSGWWFTAGSESIAIMIAHTALDGEAGSVKRFRHPGRRFLLFKSQFRMGMNAMAQCDEVDTNLVEAFAGAGFGVHGSSSVSNLTPGRFLLKR